jgi:membrane protease YdiL (CAAX protease family)
MSDVSSDTPHSRPKNRWRPNSVVLLSVASTLFLGLVLYIVPSVVASILVTFGALAAGVSATHIDTWLQTEAVAQFVYYLITEAIVIGAVVLLMRQFRETWNSIGVRKPSWKHIKYVIAGFLTYYVLYVVIATVVSQIVHLDFDQRQEIGFDTHTSGIGLAMAFIGLVILPPLAEETLFRGFLYTRFRHVLPTIWSAVLLSLLFAAAHLQFGSGNKLLWVAALDTFILSMVLVYVRVKSGTIWAGAGIHALKNLLAFLILFNVVSIPGG